MAKQFTSSEILDLMRKTSLMSLAVSDKDGQPQSHMMLFAIDDDFTLYFATTKDSGKHKAIQYNNKVGISVLCNEIALVQMAAEVFELQNEDAVQAIDKLADAATELPNFWPPVLRIIKENYAVFKVIPKSIRALDLTDSTMTSAQSMFTNIRAQL
ncbi:pyridoxamine 5'-phosphate oxidase family protein [Candidatus Woesebacteria bacterium]|nr:pyridoxamine 5'-phosphate oxidase family protein [Candidatus Woesebacteria bacterium]